MTTNSIIHLPLIVSLLNTRSYSPQLTSLIEMANIILIVLCAIIAGVNARPGLVAAPLAYAAAPVAVAAPLAYANAPLDAAFASHRIDVNQNYNAAVLPVAASYAPVAATFAAAPLKYTAASVFL